MNPCAKLEGIKIASPVASSNSSMSLSKGLSEGTIRSNTSPE